VNPKTPDPAAYAIPAAVLLVAIVLLAALALRDESSPDAARPASHPTPAPSATPADRGGTPAPSARPSESGSAAPSDPTATVCVPPTAPRRLSVLTFNIHSARARDGRVDLATIGREIAAWDADVVLLQEVDRGRAWTGRVDMPAVLAGRLGTSWTFGSNVRRSPTNQYGTAILSRYPILSSRNTLLPAPPGTQQRGLLRATIDVDGVPLSVYDTHLENGSHAARLRQIRTIVPILRADPRPKLLGGDLNSVPGSPMLAAARTAVTDTWPEVASDAGLTAPGGNPRVRIDYLMYAGGQGVQLTPLRAQLLTSAVSDHRAVRATYRVSADGRKVCVPVLGGNG
jgi:endonuclease/exonuclease/phosphatase family metal-dependent hydrolase